tara:strand:+ start:237 stop:356 length:120 start_codon:yes stop_codon:yes gene_type:complete
MTNKLGSANPNRIPKPKKKLDDEIKKALKILKKDKKDKT